MEEIIKLINMKAIMYGLYRIFLMPYLERDKYFEELCDDAETECDTLASKILLERGRKK